ncbi:MAG TPA: hypothetical protein PKC28_01810 [Bdellovibrionales bacterium]|nr:hypothetical protein [Bdellovibrionales bacterium]
MRKRATLVLGLVFLASCTWAPRREIATEAGRRPSARLPFINDERPECLGMIQDFCQALFSPVNQGTMHFHMGESKYAVRMGETENDFKERDYEFLSAKLRAWPRLPTEFRQVLSENDFRVKLGRHLARAARGKMSLRQRVQNMRDEEEINSIWNLAIREVVLTKMEAGFPNYARIKEDFMPAEIRYESLRQRRMLLSKIAKALWTDHPNWREVERKFERVKSVYKDVIRDRKELPQDVRADWLQRIDSVDLIIPGADPEEDMENCARNETNAYYMREKNYITVCAGDFNTEEIEQTLAHELGHALDFGRTLHLFQESSPLGEALAELQERSCSKQNFSCEKWADTKARFLNDLGQSHLFKPQLPEFNRCLQEKNIKEEMPEDYVVRRATEDLNAVLGQLARRNVFLRIISPDIPLPDGKVHKNPMYLNPCGYYLWDTQAQPLDDDVSLLLFFTAEYRCSGEPDRTAKFRRAIEMAKALQLERIKTNLRLQGKFSADKGLDRDGYASSPVERFADSLGQLVFARLLNEEPDVRKRRARYLANNAWMCREPSIQNLFPGEATFQRTLYVEAHSEFSSRQKELLTADIRKSLQCKRDFSVKQCLLP